ncbi:hypothetical protein A2U01_0117143, partial [Trifolium medium]|nr:hypothetical protein [Trifolium medium]
MPIFPNKRGRECADDASPLPAPRSVSKFVPRPCLRLKSPPRENILPLPHPH